MGRASRTKRERGETRTLYHFTSTYHLPLIEDAGFLRTTDSHVPGKDVVWLMDLDSAEAGHGLTGSSVNKREVRFTVKVRAVRWLDWVKNRIDPAWLQILIDTGGGIEAARHWYVTEQPVPRSAWVTVETLTRA